jgi:hypothetical protein
MRVFNLGKNEFGEERISTLGQYPTPLTDSQWALIEGSRKNKRFFY